MLLPTITTKQKEILHYLYRFRFLNRIQIQTLLNHKDAKNTNAWLKDLTTKNYTGRIFEKTAGINKPAIYYLSKSGIKFFSSAEGTDKKRLRKLYQENRRSQGFIDQCMLIADIYLKLRAQNLSDLKFYTQADFATNSIISDLQPSFAYIYSKDTKLQHYTCEIIKDGTPRFAIRSRTNQYIEFFKNQPDMQIVFVCQSKKILEFVQKYIEKAQAMADTELSIHTTLL